MEECKMAKIRSLFYLMFAGILLTGCISIPTGDGGKIKVSKDGLEMEGEDGEKANVEVDTEDGGYTVTSDGGKSAQVGSHAEIPENFPKDVLIPSDKKPIMAVDSSEEEKITIMLGFEMDDNMEDSTKKYEKYLKDNGYEVQVIEMADTVKAYQGNKEGSFLSYQFMKDEEDNSYSLQVMYGER